MLYFIWKKRGFEASTPRLSEALGYEDDRQIRDIVSDLLEKNLIKVKKRKRQKDKWIITQKGENKIAFLVFPASMNIFFISVGIAAIYTAASAYISTTPIQPSTLIGLGIMVLMFAFFLRVLRKDFEKELFRIDRGQSVPGKGQDAPDKG